MYVPDSFNVNDQADIEVFLHRYDFATLVSTASDGLTATHLPVLVRREASGLIVLAMSHGQIRTGGASTAQQRRC